MTGLLVMLATAPNASAQVWNSDHQPPTIASPDIEAHADELGTLWRRRDSNPRDVPGKGGPGERAQGALGAGRGGRDGGDRERVLRAGGVIPHDIRPQLPNYRGDDAE
jgi:hypothetical protein